MADWLLILLRIALLSYLGLGLLLYFGQSGLIFQPTPAESEYPITPANIGLAFEPVGLARSESVQLHGWFIPAQQERGVVLFLHGNAGNLSHRLDSIEIFHRLGYSVFIIDYRGYGLSQGRITSETQLYQDVEAAWDYLIQTRGYRPQQVVVFGRSLGGALAAYLAQKHDPAGLMIESGFTSLEQFAGEQYPLYPVRWMLRYRLPSEEYLRQARCPVLIGHSPDDEIIPYRHGRALYAAAPSPKTWLELQGGHNDGFLRSGTAYQEGLERFFNSLGGN